jgi:hypothetical protein
LQELFKKDIFVQEVCMKKWSLILVVIGIAMVGFAYYINAQVADGKLKVSSAEESVSRGKSLFSGSPVSKQVGEGLFSGADKKIANANEEIAYYENLAQTLQIVGWICIVVGLGLFFVGRRQ